MQTRAPTTVWLYNIHGRGNIRGPHVSRERKPVLLRIDPAVHDALARWANDELRSINAQIEMLLRRALTDAGRMPRAAGPLPRRGRPPGS